MESPGDVRPAVEVAYNRPAGPVIVVPAASARGYLVNDVLRFVHRSGGRSISGNDAGSRRSSSNPRSRSV